MPEAYVRLADLKEDLNLSGTGDDGRLLRLAERVSRAADDYCRRHFYALARAQRLFDGDGSAALRLYDDLYSLGAVSVDNDGDGTYELTVAASELIAVPHWGPPYRELRLAPWATTVVAWPQGVATVRITDAVWGYSYETEDTGQTVANAGGLSAGATTLEVQDGSAISQGEALVIDQEQLYVGSVSGTNVAVRRGHNGTTAAAHAQGTPVLRRRYPRPVEEAVAMQVSRFWEQRRTGFMLPDAAVGGGLGRSFSTLYPAIREMLGGYRLVVVG